MTKYSVAARKLTGMEAVAVTRLRLDVVVTVDGHPADVEDARLRCYTQPGTVVAVWRPTPNGWPRSTLDDLKRGVVRGQLAPAMSGITDDAERRVRESMDELTYAWQLAKIERGLWDIESKALRASGWSLHADGGWVRADPTSSARVLEHTRVSRERALLEIGFCHESNEDLPRSFDICVTRSNRTSARYSTLPAMTTAMVKASGSRLFRDPLVTDVTIIERGVREWHRSRSDKAWTCVSKSTNLPQERSR